MQEQIPKSYELANGSWVARVEIRTHTGNELKEQSQTWDEKFDTEETANAFVKARIAESKS